MYFNINTYSYKVHIRFYDGRLNANHSIATMVCYDQRVYVYVYVNQNKLMSSKQDSCHISLRLGYTS